MKKILILSLLFITPSYAAFDFGKLVEDVVKEAAKTTTTPRNDNKPKDENAPTMTREGYTLNGGANSDRYNDIHRFYYDETVKVAPSKYTIDAYLKQLQEYCPEKFNTKRCQYAEEQVNVMKGHTIRNKLAKNISTLKRDRPNYSSQNSVVNLTEAENLIEEYKLGNHTNDRTVNEIYDDIRSETSIIEAKLKKEEELKQQQDIKMAKFNQTKFVDKNIGAVKASVFNSPYNKCLVGGERFISYGKLVNSTGISKEDELETRTIFKEQCGCTYVTIHKNSVNASDSDRRVLANDLTKFETFKLKEIGRESTQWETEKFKRSLNNGNIMFLSYTNASDACD